MPKKLHKILVTGGAGFIGSAFVRLAVKNRLKVIVVDKLTYAGDLARLANVKNKIKFYKVDINNKPAIERIIKKENPDVIVNFAAESHVDRSIKDPTTFIKSNISGVQVLMDAARKQKVQLFVQISTDEVYGDIEKGKFKEGYPLKPNSPYAASKAAADLLIKSYIRTFGFPAIIIRPSNNYGPWQYPEKLIPLAITKLILNKKVPVYAQGKNVREWLFVEDCAKAIFTVLKLGKNGEVYNLGSGQEKHNIDVVKSILKLLKCNTTKIEFVKDRPGHDLRYSLDSNKIRKELGCKCGICFDKGIKETVCWCIDNQDWLLKKFKGV